MKGMRVCITGATGFLGGALARALAPEGAEIHALARATSDRSVLADMPVVWHEGDITHPETLHGFVAGASYVIHAAGKIGKAGDSEREYRLSNVEGTRNVIAAAMTAESHPRVLYLSTTGVLGPTPPGRLLAEDSPYAPSNAYERSKADAEKLALGFAGRGFAVIIARPGFVYGPGDRHVLRLFDAIRRRRFFYIDGGRSLCHPTFVADAVAGMLLCLKRGRPAEIYHIAGADPVTLRQFAETIAAELRMAPPRLSLPRRLVWAAAACLEAKSRIAGGTPPLSRTGVAFFSEDRAYSWGKAHQELGYSPQCDLRKGVHLTVAWIRQECTRLRIDKSTA